MALFIFIISAQLKWAVIGQSPAAAAAAAAGELMEA